MKLMGIIPPVVTPLHADEPIDFDGLRAHIDYMFSKGVHGIFPVDTTGDWMRGTK